MVFKISNPLPWLKKVILGDDNEYAPTAKSALRTMGNDPEDAHATARRFFTDGEAKDIQENGQAVLAGLLNAAQASAQKGDQGDRFNNAVEVIKIVHAHSNKIDFGLTTPDMWLNNAATAAGEATSQMYLDIEGPERGDIYQQTFINIVADTDAFTLTGRPLSQDVRDSMNENFAAEIVGYNFPTTPAAEVAAPPSIGTEPATAPPATAFTPGNPWGAESSSAGGITPPATGMAEPEAAAAPPIIDFSDANAVMRAISARPIEAAALGARFFTSSSTSAEAITANGGRIIDSMLTAANYQAAEGRDTMAEGIALEAGELLVAYGAAGQSQPALLPEADYDRLLPQVFGALGQASRSAAHQGDHLEAADIHDNAMHIIYGQRSFGDQDLPLNLTPEQQNSLIETLTNTGTEGFGVYNTPTTAPDYDFLWNDDVTSGTQVRVPATRSGLDDEPDAEQTTGRRWPWQKTPEQLAEEADQDKQSLARLEKQGWNGMFLLPETPITFGDRILLANEAGGGAVKFTRNGTQFEGGAENNAELIEMAILRVLEEGGTKVNIKGPSASFKHTAALYAAAYGMESDYPGQYKQDFQDQVARLRVQLEQREADKKAALEGNAIENPAIAPPDPAAVPQNSPLQIPAPQAPSGEQAGGTAVTEAEANTILTESGIAPDASADLGATATPPAPPSSGPTTSGSGATSFGEPWGTPTTTPYTPAAEPVTAPPPASGSDYTGGATIDVTATATPIVEPAAPVTVSPPPDLTAYESAMAAPVTTTAIILPPPPAEAARLAQNVATIQRNNQTFILNNIPPLAAEAPTGVENQSQGAPQPQTPLTTGTGSNTRKSAVPKPVTVLSR
jgi:hypothetical protein